MCGVWVCGVCFIVCSVCVGVRERVCVRVRVRVRVRARALVIASKCVKYSLVSAPGFFFIFFF